MQIFENICLGRDSVEEQKYSQLLTMKIKSGCRCNNQRLKKRSFSHTTFSLPGTKTLLLFPLSKRLLYRTKTSESDPKLHLERSRLHPLPPLRGHHPSRDATWTIVASSPVSHPPPLVEPQRTPMGNRHDRPGSGRSGTLVRQLRIDPPPPPPAPFAYTHVLEHSRNVSADVPGRLRAGPESPRAPLLLSESRGL